MSYERRKGENEFCIHGIVVLLSKLIPSLGAKCRCTVRLIEFIPRLFSRFPLDEACFEKATALNNAELISVNMSKEWTRKLPHTVN